MAQTVYVAFLDILGFRDLVNNNPHEVLEKLYGNIFSGTIALCLSGGAVKLVDAGDRQVAIADCQRIKVNSLVVSDSIICWTSNDSMKSFIDIVLAARNMLANGFFVGMPLRGAIALGPLSTFSQRWDSQTDNFVNTFFGKGIVDAYKIESSQEWSGCVVSDPCIERYNEHCARYASQMTDLATLEYLIQAKLLANYLVPFKENVEQRQYVVNWPTANKTPRSEERVRKAFGMHNKTTSHPSTGRKIENTITFLRRMLS